MVEKLIPVDDDIGLGKLCQAMVRHCSICLTPTDGAPLCDRCAKNLRRDCRLTHLAIAKGACVGSGTIRNLRRDKARLAEYDEWVVNEEHAAWLAQSIEYNDM